MPSSQETPSVRETPDIALDKDSLQSLGRLARVSQHLEKILTAAVEIEAQPGIYQITENVAQKTGIELSTVRQAIFPLLSIYQTQLRLKAAPEQTIKAFTDAFDRNATDSQGRADFAAWQKAQSAITKALATLGPDHPLVISQKAAKVVFAHEHILTTAQILTDVRPVFNSAADQIKQMIITHVLSVSYSDGTSERQIQFALDAVDLAELKKACQRAEQKARTVKDALKAMPWNTLIFRE